MGIARRVTTKSSNLQLPPDLTSWFIQDLQELTRDNDSEFKFSYLGRMFLTKFVSHDTAPADVRRQRAIEKWLSVEAHNANTNEFLRNVSPDWNVLPRVRLETFLEVCRRIIRSVIGDTPSWDRLMGGFSGGASTSLPRLRSNPATKFLEKADATELCHSCFFSLTEESPRWSAHIEDTWRDPRIVEGNILFTVPKSTEIDRCAAKEPDLNMFVQRGLGSQIREGLRKHGINLNDQSRNRSLAQQGSIDGSLATVDLSSASDSMCYELVFALMPYPWFSMLDASRCHITVIDGVRHHNEMFSSMGNGFTFELESLLFYSIARTIAYFRGVPGTISVYGDDIIIPSVLYSDLEWVLKTFGFSVNPEKSFSSGPFRESCGGHYYRGGDVTPFYLRRPLTYLTDLILILNQLRSWGRCGNICDPRITSIWEFYSSYIPRSLNGGQDLASNCSLVDGSPPLNRLVERVRTVDQSHIGAYLFWLHTRDSQHTSSPVLISKRSVGTGVFREKRNRQTVSKDIPALI